MELLINILELLQNWVDWWVTPIHATNDLVVYQANVALIPLFVSLATTAYGMYKKNQSDKTLQSQQEGINAKMGDLSSWYNAESSKDFLDTDSAQSALGNIREQYKKSLETGNNNAAKGGLTAEAQVAQKGVLQEKYNDVLRNLTGYGTQYKQNMKRDYQGSLNQLYANNQSTYGPESQSWGNFIGNSSQVTGSAIESTDWDKIFGGSTPPVTG